MKTVEVGNFFKIERSKLTLMGGPCSIENEEICFEVAETVSSICKQLDINYVFKASFDKANRSSLNAGRAIGMQKGLKVLENVRNVFNVPVTTDVHESYQCNEVGAVVDIIQIPAFLCRQTDLLLAAASTKKLVSVKKGQFMAPQNMDNVIHKIQSCKNESIILIERGFSFGYNRLVVDMTAIPIMQNTGYPVFIDATHSVQEPGGKLEFTGGNRLFAPLLMNAALAAGADGIFAEIHPNPDKAISDAESQIELSNIESILKKAALFHKVNRGEKL